MHPINKHCHFFTFFNFGSIRFIYLLIALLTSQTITAQINNSGHLSLRRQFVIAYDIRSAETPNNQINNLLLSLFSNTGMPNNIGFESSELFKSEIKEGKSFFDPSTDAISFFHFGVSSHDFAFIRGVITDSPKDSNLINKTFIDYFIKNTELSFSVNDKSVSGDYERVNKVFRSFFDKKPNDSFNSGYSNQGFVFPFVLTNLSENIYASEYFLIIVGPNDSPAHNDNLFYPLPDDGRTALNFISKYQKYLSSFLDTVPYFSTTTNNSQTTPHNTPPTSILRGFKIVPNSGTYSGNGQEYSIESNIYLSQPILATTKFKISATDIKSKLDDHFSLKAIDLSIFTKEGDRTHAIIDTAFAIKTNEKWESHILSSSNLNITDLEQIIRIPGFQIQLPALYQNQSFDKLLFKYTLYNQYHVSDNLKLNYIYTVHKSVAKQNIQYSSKFFRIFMLYLLPAIMLAIIIIFLFYYGKPRGLGLRIEGYLDSYEIINYQDNGRINTPYKFWNTKEDSLIVYGEIYYNRTGYIFNWNPKIFVKIQEALLTQGFAVFLKQDVSSINEFSPDLDRAMSVTKNKKNQFSFIFTIRQNDITRKIVDPQMMKIKIEGVIQKSFMFYSHERRESIEYSFHIGPDLGEVWVGFDPGTSGSCLAVGTSTDNIILGTKTKIIPSIIVFDTSENYIPNGKELPQTMYYYGSAAYTLYESTGKYIGFRSLKKLLGFINTKEIKFQNNNTLRLRGKDLASLLVKGLFRDLVTYFEKADIRIIDYTRNGVFNPQRAVVAIPNNFTINKIQDMIDCIKALNQFRDIRFIHEAEAVLFYYLSKYRLLNKVNENFTKETILVFDMGGATMNATVVSARIILENNLPKYDIDIMGKIGYGIGGDTIDYCLAKFILSFTDEFPEFKSIHGIDKIAKLAKAAEGIKIDISRKYYNPKEEIFITSQTLTGIINSALGLSIVIDQETSELFSYFKRGKKYNFKLFEHPIFVNTIFNNVTDAIREVIELSNHVPVDKVIFSGRSTFFPMIKETVKAQLNAYGMNAGNIVMSEEESKTAVTKGACWYGINRNAVRLNNLKTNASFGFKMTIGDNIEYLELVKMGHAFSSHGDSIGWVAGKKDIEHDFAFDGDKVNYYQIMGKDAKLIIEEKQKHKFSKIASITLPKITSQVAMKVNESDEVECIVRLKTKEKLTANGHVSDQEIDEANEEHYTWVVK